MSLEPTELFPEVPNLYEFPSVHSEMIYDEHRVGAYQRAINRTIKHGDVVVDVGTGTGLLAFLCLQAGAKNVHAIDRSPIIECARDLAVANRMAERVTFYYSDSRESDIGETADVMISELIGHIAFEEGMVETLFDAKRRFLKPGGSMIPRDVTLYAAPVFEREVYSSSIAVWKRAYGIDYSVMRQRAIGTSYITLISESDLLAKEQPIFSVDFVRETAPELQTERRFSIHRNGEVNGVALWFDATLAQDVRLSSGPWSKTHWRQCFAPISDPIYVNSGDTLDVSISMKLRSRKDDRFVFAVDIRKGGNHAPS